MPIATITVNLPTTRTDGTALAPSDFSGVEIFADGASIAKLSAGVLTATDPNVVPGTTSYTATVSDNQDPPSTSALSAPVVAGSLAVPLPPPGVPTLTVTVT